MSNNIHHIYLAPVANKEIPDELLEKFFAYTDVNALVEPKVSGVDGRCWIWMGCQTQDGYGLVNFRHELDGFQWNKQAAHRLSFRIFKGELPEGRKWVVNHRCYNRDCVNPEHLELLSQRQNSRDAYHRRVATAFMSGWAVGKAGAAA